MAENVVTVRYLRERQTVSNDTVKLHVTVRNVLHQLFDMLMSGSLTGLNDDALIENLAQREVVEWRGVHTLRMDTKPPRRTFVTMPNELVAQRLRSELGLAAIVDVQVGPANGSAGDADNGIARFMDFEVVDCITADITHAANSKSFHKEKIRSAGA